MCDGKYLAQTRVDLSSQRKRTRSIVAVQLDKDVDEAAGIASVDTQNRPLMDS